MNQHSFPLLACMGFFGVSGIKTGLKKFFLRMYSDFFKKLRVQLDVICFLFNHSENVIPVFFCVLKALKQIKLQKNLIFTEGFFQNDLYKYVEGKSCLF